MAYSHLLLSKLKLVFFEERHSLWRSKTLRSTNVIYFLGLGKGCRCCVLNQKEDAKWGEMKKRNTVAKMKAENLYLANAEVFNA